MAARSVHHTKISLEESKLLKNLKLGQLLCVKKRTRSTQSVNSEEYGHFTGYLTIRVDNEHGESHNTSSGEWRFKEIVSNNDMRLTNVIRNPIWTRYCLAIHYGNLYFNKNYLQKLNADVFGEYEGTSDECFHIPTQMRYGYIKVDVSVFFKRVSDDDLKPGNVYKILMGDNYNLERHISMKDDRFYYCYSDESHGDVYNPHFGFTKEEVKKMVVVSIDKKDT
jgi:hypothetical protein